MENTERITITIQATVNATLDTVWKCWTQSEHIMHWNFADISWHCPQATNDLVPGGTFLYRMEAKDGSMGFDFGGIYEEVQTHALIAYVLGDGRNVRITFEAKENNVEIVETFEAEESHTIEQQQMGWQSILDNFKNYAESV